ncbi:MAG: hypothetical protein U0264_16900 [Candidatus Kapaibacterium sp.]
MLLRVKDNLFREFNDISVGTIYKTRDIVSSTVNFLGDHREQLPIMVAKSWIVLDQRMIGGATGGGSGDNATQKKQKLHIEISAFSVRIY